MKTGVFQKAKTLAVAASTSLMLTAGAAWAKTPTKKPTNNARPPPGYFFAFHFGKPESDTISYASLYSKWTPKPPNPNIPGDDSLVPSCFVTPLIRPM